MAGKQIVTYPLLAFVLVSIGFALGREAERRSRPPAVAGQDAAAGADKLVVYYMHGAARCVTCNRIEKMTHEVVHRDFADAVKAGQVEWRVVNWQKEEDLATRYDVSSSSVVLVEFRKGKEVRFEKLKDVFKFADEPGMFMPYVAGAISSHLGEEGP